MTNYSGQPFAPHFSLTKGLTNELPFLNNTNARLFFGVQGSNTTFDDLSIDAFCSPRRARATANLVNGFVVGATITDTGCGYLTPPLVLIQGGGGNGATATAVLEQGKVIAININNAGCCYTNVPVIEIASPPFVPTLSIAVSKVKVTQQVVLGRRYVLESTTNMMTWSQVGAPFSATNETIVSELDVDLTGQYFRIREVP